MAENQIDGNRDSVSRSSESTHSIEESSETDASYEALLAELESKPTGRIRSILPNAVYRLLFGSKPPDPEEVRQQRDEIASKLDALTSEFDEKCGDHIGVPESDRLEAPVPFPRDEQVQAAEIDQLITSFYKGTGKPDLSAYQHLVDEKITQLRALQVDIQAFLSTNTRRYLRTAEQRKLKSNEQVVSATLDALRERVLVVDVTEAITGNLEEWQTRVETLDDRMQPYLSYETYEVRDGVVTETETLQENLQAAKENADLTLLGEKDREIFHECLETVTQYAERLDGYQDEVIRRKYELKLVATENKLKQLLDDLVPARTTGAPLVEESARRSQLSDHWDATSEIRSLPLEAHITDRRLEKLAMLERQIDDVEAFIDAKTVFDTRIEDVETAVTSLEAAAEPYLEYTQYLTTPEAKAIHDVLEESFSQIAVLREVVDLHRLGQPDRNKCDAVIERVSTVETCLDGYNQAFLERERERYRDLFTDIGPANLDLTADQQRAVIRNDINNQVIAAAGTGKTLVLTTRVAYLIRSQGIDPRRILVVTFTNEASDEMETRLNEYFEITEVTVSTIHAFGNGIVTETAVSTNSIDPHQTYNIIEREIRSARNGNNETFLDHYYEFLVHFDDVYLDEADFDEKAEYVQKRQEQRYQTLQNEEVKSQAEKRIADFLFTHKVEYRYEDIATWAETGADKGQYEPDFYLPEYDIYIEHWGLDTAGEIAPWFTQETEDYHRKMRWARDQFETREYRLVETYNFEHEAGNLNRALRHRLQHHGVELDRMGFDELVDTAFDYEQREDWIKRQFKNFIQNAKLFDVKPDGIESNLKSDNPRQYHFGQCGIMLLQQYQRFLIENGLIDFNDMLSQALGEVRTRPEQYRSRYDHLLVDEFQDIGRGMLELLQELSGLNAARLFAVGDDWQSIYSFQGAEVQYFVNFEKHFGPTTRTRLTENFRSPETVVDAGNTLIKNHDTQIDKQVESTIDVDMAPLVHDLQGFTFYDYVHRVSRHTVKLVREYLREGSSPEDIMVLCRYDDAVPYLDEIKDGLRDEGIPYVGKSDRYRGQGSTSQGVAVYSVHQSKGREAKHVILVHAVEGTFGFPPEDRENELLDPVQPIAMNTLAEERRAFYVAITRTERTLDVLTRTGQRSRFLDEIDAHTNCTDQLGAIEPLDDVGSEMAVTARVKRLFTDLHPKEHQDGILVDQYGGSARFISWASTNPPTLEAGEWYRFDGVEVDKFKDRKELVVTAKSSITRLENPEMITAGSMPVTEN